MDAVTPVSDGGEDLVPVECDDHRVITSSDPQESRWPPLIALIAAAALYATLPPGLILGGGWMRFVVPALEVGLVVGAAVPPVAESNRRRHLGIALAAIITVANASAIGLLVTGIATGSGFEGKHLMVAALQVWATNVIIFGLWYWEADGGGPRQRALGVTGPGDLLFAQHTLPGPWTWRPVFFDYLYLSFTNSTSFAPADVMPLSHRMKALMALESLLSLLTILVVASRAVNILL